MSEDESGFDEFVDDQLSDNETGEVEGVNVNALIQRQMAWDMFPCAVVENVLQDQGFIPGTPENAELEHSEAHIRLAQVVPLTGHIFALGGFAGEMLFKARVNQSSLELTEDEMAKGVMLYQDTVRAGSSGVISALIEMGILQINPEAVHVQFLG